MNNPEIIVKNAPFKHFCMSIGAIPTSYKDSLDYYETLLWLIKYLEETIIPTVNNNGEAVSELQRLYIELKDFVENYFANLDVQQEINNKLDEMVEDGTFETIVASYLAKKVDYFKITSEMSESDIKEILEKNTPRVIDFESGTYTFTDYINIGSHAKILLNGSTLDTTAKSKPMLFYTSSDTFTGYDGVHDIIIENGNIGISSALMHNSNITFNNINFLSTLTTHAIQMGGCKDIKITNCTFNGIVLNDSIGNVTEMIQLETCTSAGQPYISSDSVMFNNLGNFNIEISNCIFNMGDGINSKFYVGIGHHSENSNNIYSQENIKIYNNKFYNATYSAISIYGLVNSDIYNNYFELTNNYNDNITIRFRGNNKFVNIFNNTFKGFQRAIENVSVKECSYFKIYNNTFLIDEDISTNTIVLKSFINTEITNNYIETNGRGILLAPYGGYDVKNITISNNKFFNSNNVNCTIQCNNTVDNIRIYDNFSKINVDKTFLYYLGENENTPLYYANNYIENLTYNIKDIDMPLTTSATNIYNNIYNLYSQTTDYVALTSETPKKPFNEFNRLDLTFSLDGDATRMFTTVIHPFVIYDKMISSLDVDRTFKFAISDRNNQVHIATLKINTDGTFDYSSESDSISLCRIDGYNLLLH